MYEDPNYGTLVWNEDDGSQRIEVLTCLEPECERGPCKQPDEHERWFQLHHLKGGWYSTYGARESNAVRHEGFAVLCRNCRHWAGREVTSAHQGSCRKAHPINNNGSPMWPATRHDEVCGEWLPSARVLRVVRAREKPRQPDGEVCHCPQREGMHVHSGIGIHAWPALPGEAP